MRQPRSRADRIIAATLPARPARPARPRYGAAELILAVTVLALVLATAVRLVAAS